MEPQKDAETSSSDVKECSTESNNTKKYGMLIFILFLQFVSRGADTMIFLFYPETALSKGLTMADVGIVYAMYDLARFISSPVFGSILSKWPPKSMCIIGLAICGVCLVIFGHVGSLLTGWCFLAVCIILRGLAGAGSAMVTISTASILLKASGIDSNTIVGIVEVVLNTAFFCGQAWGGLLYNFVGYVPTFWVVGGVLLLSILPTGFFIPNIVEEKKKSQKSFFRLLEIPGCLLMYSSCVLTRLQGASRSIGITQLYLNQLHSNPAILGAFYGVISLVYIVVCSIATSLVKKFPWMNYKAMITGWILAGITLLLLCPSPLLDFIFHGKHYFWLSTVDILLMYMFWILVYIPPFPVSLNMAEVNGYDRDSLHTYGMITGLVNSGWGLGATVGPVISGAIIGAQGFGRTSTYLAFTDFLLALLIGFYVFYMKVTGQPTEVVKTEALKEEAKTEFILETKEFDEIKKTNEKIIEKYLGRSQSFTRVHLQQPSISDTLPE